MKKWYMLLLLAGSVLSTALQAQTAKEDMLIGTFVNKDAGLLLSVQAKAGGGYEGFFEYQGQRFPFAGTKLLGMLSGEYTYEGSVEGFTLARILGVYYVTSDGASLEVERISATPADPGKPNPVQAPAPSAAASGPVSTQAPPAGGSRIQDPNGQFSFQLPATWTHALQEGSLLISKSGLQAQIGMVPHNYSSLQEIRSNVSDVQDWESNTFLKASIQQYGANSLFIRLEGKAQGQPLTIEMIALLSPHGGGVNVVGTALTPNYKPEITTAIKTIANSVQFMKPTVSPAAQQWTQRVSGKQLVYLYTGNGLSDKITIDLCSNGRFQYYSNSSYTSGGYADFSYAGRDSNSGTWKVISRNNQTLLVLYYNGGKVSEYELTNRPSGDGINLNGRRYFTQAAQACN